MILYTILSELFLVLYLMPLSLCYLYFTIGKIEDINRSEKHYTEGRPSYLQYLGISLIPIANIIMAISIVKQVFQWEEVKRIPFYWKAFFLAQVATISILAGVGKPTSAIKMYIWLGVAFLDMVITHPIWYDRGAKKDERTNQRDS
jgi:uncharacterized membrane protein